MAITQPKTLIRSACFVSAVAIAATVLTAGSPVASAAPIGGSPASTLTSLDNPANWAAVRQAALTGYVVPAKYAASCGATQ
jgi:hypothetical protein